MVIKRLKDLREDNDLSQRELCEMIKYKQQTYSYYETGNRTLPYDLLIKLANFYSTSTDYILGITNEKKPYPRCSEKK